MSIELFKDRGLCLATNNIDYQYVTLKYKDKNNSDATFSFPILGIQVKHTSDITIQKVLGRDLVVADFGQNPVVITISGITPCAATLSDQDDAKHLKAISLNSLVTVYNTDLSNKSKPVDLSVDGITYKGIITNLGYKSYKQFPSVLIYSMSFIGYKK